MADLDGIDIPQTKKKSAARRTPAKRSAHGAGVAAMEFGGKEMNMLPWSTASITVRPVSGLNILESLLRIPQSITEPPS